MDANLREETETRRMIAYFVLSNVAFVLAVRPRGHRAESMRVLPMSLRLLLPISTRVEAARMSEDMPKGLGGAVNSARSA